MMFNGLKVINMVATIYRERKNMTQYFEQLVQQISQPYGNPSGYDSACTLPGVTVLLLHIGIVVQYV